MSTIAKINNVSWSSISKRKGIEVASLSNISGVSKPISSTPILIGENHFFDLYTPVATYIPAGVQNGDLLFLAMFTRNGTIGTLAGWTRILYVDRSTTEMTGIYVRVANNEPAHYIFSHGGSNYYILAAFRSVGGTYTDIQSVMANPPFPSANGINGGIAIATCGANLHSVQPWTSIGGDMTFIVNERQHGDTQCAMAWKILTADGATGTFETQNANYDGYVTVTFPPV